MSGKEDFMDLKQLLGDKYKENMTLDEINAALADRNLVDPSTLGETVPKATFDKTASDLAKLKKELGDRKAANMTDAERQAQLMADLEAQKKSFTIKSNRLDVEKVLVAAGLSETEYAPFIDGIVTEDADASVAVAQNIAKALGAKAAAASAAAKRDKINDTPTPKDGKTLDTSMTLESLRKLDPTARHEFYVNHPEEYRALYENNGG